MNIEKINFNLNVFVHKSCICENELIKIKVPTTCSEDKFSKAHLNLSHLKKYFQQ